MYSNGLLVDWELGVVQGFRQHSTSGDFHLCRTVLFIFHIFFKACGGSGPQGLPAAGGHVLREGDLSPELRSASACCWR